MQVSPRIHKFTVELQDIHHKRSNYRIKRILEDALDYGLHHKHADFEFVRVTDYTKSENGSWIQRAKIAEFKLGEAQKKVLDLEATIEAIREKLCE